MVHAIIKLQGEEGRVVSVSAKRLLWKHICWRTSLQAWSLHKSFQWTAREGGGETRGGLSKTGAFLHVPRSCCGASKTRINNPWEPVSSSKLHQSEECRRGASWHGRIPERDAVIGASFSTRDAARGSAHSRDRTKRHLE